MDGFRTRGLTKVYKNKTKNYTKRVSVDSG